MVYRTLQILGQPFIVFGTLLSQTSLVKRYEVVFSSLSTHCWDQSRELAWSSVVQVESLDRIVNFTNKTNFERLAETCKKSGKTSTPGWLCPQSAHFGRLIGSSISNNLICLQLWYGVGGSLEWRLAISMRDFSMIARLRRNFPSLAFIVIALVNRNKSAVS